MIFIDSLCWTAVILIYTMHGISNDMQSWINKSQCLFLDIYRMKRCWWFYLTNKRTHAKLSGYVFMQWCIQSPKKLVNNGLRSLTFKLLRRMDEPMQSWHKARFYKICMCYYSWYRRLIFFIKASNSSIVRGKCFPIWFILFSKVIIHFIYWPCLKTRCRKV